MKRLFKWFVSVVLVVVILGAAAGFYVYNEMQPVAKAEQPVIISIEPGTGTAGIAELLETQGLIKNSFIFRSYVKLKSEGSRFQAGVYELMPGVTFDEIIAKLNSGDVVKEEMIRFTIPEGYTVMQMADKLDEQGLANKEVFLELANEALGIQNELLAAIPVNDQLTYRLEGYLFPETYELKKDSTEADIIQRMIDEMKQRLDGISQFQEKLTQSEMSLNELMTVASLVEREVVVDSERSKVAGVIYNRLAKGMKLEIDATVQYLLDKPKDRLLYSDLRSVDSPYNTYLYAGLPPGPIAAPGLKSIEAALAPEKSDYLFYVTKKDGSGEHFFAETYEEHLNNIKKSKAMAK